MVGPFDRWKLWLYRDAEDTALTSAKPSILTDRSQKGASGVIDVRGIEKIAIRGFGTDANNETFDMLVYGMMDNGPVQKVLELNCILGAQQFGAAEPFLDGVGVPPLDYFEVDTFTEVSTNDALGAAQAQVTTTLVNTHYLIPTLGFKFLWAKLCNFDGVTGVEAAKAGIIWRPTALLVEHR